MDRELFELWFEKLFLPNCGKERPVVLFSDNHSSRDSPKVIKLARENEVNYSVGKFN